MLRKGDVIDGFTLLKPFQHSDRVWLATREGQRFTLKFAPLEARGNEAGAHAIRQGNVERHAAGGRLFLKAFVPEKATTRCYAMEFVEAPSLKMLLAFAPARGR